MTIIVWNLEINGTYLLFSVYDDFSSFDRLKSEFEILQRAFYYFGVTYSVRL